MTAAALDWKLVRCIRYSNSGDLIDVQSFDRLSASASLCDQSGAIAAALPFGVHPFKLAKH